MCGCVDECAPDIGGVSAVKGEIVLIKYAVALQA